jgi:deoxycytidylate deaminase
MSNRKPEIFIGLVGALGTDLNLISDIIEEELERYKYNCKRIKLSSLLKVIPVCKDLLPNEQEPLNEHDRIEKYMNAGDKLREKTGLGSALVNLCVSEIRDYRKEKTGQTNKPIPNQAYILNSFKHQDEINAARKIYGQNFILLSIYSPRNARIDVLSKKMAESEHSGDIDSYRSKAESLIKRDVDSGTLKNKLGQNVGKAYPLGDAFVKMDVRNVIKNKISRIFEIWFRHPYHTPTKNEFSMFYANAASLRSADLSRQVGAVIIGDKGEILSTGCNEVPKAFGGIFWEGDENDFRDFQIGFDANVKLKNESIIEVFSKLLEYDWISDKKELKNPKDILEIALYDKIDSTFSDDDNRKKESFLKDTRVANIIEYGRIVHAEMLAITEAARLGIKIEGSTMYCTTFPCHMCARHIISAGIRKVVYIEPYPKSLVYELYKNIISIDGESSDTKIKFEQFVGIAPNRFIELFSKSKRKNKKGEIINWDPAEAIPTIDNSFIGYINSEQVYVNSMKKFDTILGISESKGE